MVTIRLRSAVVAGTSYFQISLGPVVGQHQVRFAAIDVPGFEDFGDDGEGKARAYQAANHAGDLFVILWLLQPLAGNVAPDQFVLAHFRIRAFEGARNQFGLDTLMAELLLYAALAKALVFLAQAGVGGGEGGIIEIVLIQKPRHYGRDLGVSRLALLNLAMHQAFQLSYCAHLARQRADGILVKSRFLKRLWFLARPEWHKPLKAE